LIYIGDCDTLNYKGGENPVMETVHVPARVVHKLQEVLAELEKAMSPYKPEFLARMYRARASDLEEKGESLSEIKKRFKRN